MKIESKDKTKLSASANADSEKAPAKKQFFAFKFGDGEYCIDLNAVQEIKSWIHVLESPDSAGYEKGAVDLRGVLVPVLDISSKLGTSNSAPNKQSIVIILKLNTKLVGILADNASDILTLSPSQINPAPKDKENFVAGLIPKENSMVTLLDLQKIFDTETLSHADKLAEKMHSIETVS